MATWRVSEPAGSTTIAKGAEYIRENWTQIETCISSAKLTAGTVLHTIPAGARIWFYENVAPSGYTIVAGPSDELLAVKGGSTYTTGGAAAGTWTQPGHALTTSEIPPHSHATNATQDIKRGSGSSNWGFSSSNSQTGTTLTSGGAAAAHSHGSTWRPKARVGIICQPS
jgi:hypothetical protein